MYLLQSTTQRIKDASLLHLTSHGDLTIQKAQSPSGMSTGLPAPSGKKTTAALCEEERADLGNLPPVSRSV